MLDDLTMLKTELQEIQNKQIKLETIVEQAAQQCKEIEDKYNISSEAELKELLEKAEREYLDNIEKATAYLADAKQSLLPYEDML